MRRLRKHPNSTRLLGLMVFLASVSAYAVEATSEESAPIPCAVVEALGGQVQILDASRTHLVDAKPHAGVACGSWVSTGAAGWVKLAHRDGFKVHVGTGAFVGLPEGNTDGHATGDQVILYRGQVFAQTRSGSGELRVITPNGRARIKDGAGIVLFNRAEEETQLIGVEKSGSLENRFAKSRKVVVKAGEASVMNFKLLRVVPSYPRAIALASLRPKLVDLHVDGRERKAVVGATQHRQERKLASTLVAEDGDEHARGGRRLAAQDKPAPKAATYVRHRMSKVDGKLRAYWVKKMAGGENVGERILYPDKYYGRPQKVRVEVEDPSDRILKSGKKVEDAEKRRLIEELSQIREEE